MKTTRIAVLVGLVLLTGLSASASARRAHHARRGAMVAYDAKDKRYYSVAWARAHGMHDKGGDPLTVVPMASLPRTAKMSRAMHGRM